MRVNHRLVRLFPSSRSGFDGRTWSTTDCRGVAAQGAEGPMRSPRRSSAPRARRGRARGGCGDVFYISRYLRSPTPFAAAQTGPHEASLTLGTTPAVGKLGAQPLLGFLPGPRARPLGPDHRLQRAGPFAGPRHGLQLRRRQRAQESVPLPGAGNGGRQHAAQRQAHRRDPSGRLLAHVHASRSMAYHGPDRRASPTTRTHQCAEMPCPLEQGARDDHLHVPHGKARAVSAGSASCPAPPGSSTGSRARCRRSATWTASST